MNTCETDLAANLKWLAAHGVTNGRTRLAARRKAARTALKRLASFVAAFDDLEMLDDLFPDGSHTHLLPRLNEKWRLLRAKLFFIEKKIKEFA